MMPARPRDDDCCVEACEEPLHRFQSMVIDKVVGDRPDRIPPGDTGFVPASYNNGA